MVCVLAAFADFLDDCCAHALLTKATVGSRLKLNANGTTLRVMLRHQTFETWDGNCGDDFLCDMCDLLAINLTP
jgi:hypothetical protein